MQGIKLASPLTIVGLMTLSVPALAHHGTAGNYDQTKLITVEGVVKEFNWRNPHSALFIEGKNDAGKEGTYVLELGAPKALVDRGFTRTMFKPGDRVKVSMHPSFTHPENGQMTEQTFWVNGKELHAAASDKE